MTRAIDHASAVPTWLGLGDVDRGLGPGAARALDLLLAVVLAGGGLWLLTSTGAVDEPAPVLVATPADAPVPPPASEAPPTPAPDRGPETATPEASPPPADPPDEPEKIGGPTPPASGTAGDVPRPSGSEPRTRDPVAAASLVDRAEIALKGGKRANARKLFEEALLLDPTNAAAMMGLSNLNFDAGNYAGAERYARQAVEREPRNADYRLRLGDAYFKLGQPARARTHYERAAKLGHPSAAGRLAQLSK